MAAGVLLCSAASAAAQQGGGATTQIVNVAHATYQDANGASATTQATAVVHVNGVRVALELVPNREAAVAAGAQFVFAHRLTNLGSHDDHITLSVASTPVWTLELFNDIDGDGQLGAGDVPMTEVDLGSNIAVALLVRVTTAADAAAGSTGVIRITATSRRDPAVAAYAEDRITLVRSAAELFLSKTVDRQDAAAGDTVTYSLVARNQGGGASQAATLVDTLPRGLTFVAGSLTVDEVAKPISVSRTSDGRDILVIALGELASGARVAVTFRAAIGETMGESARNVAHLGAGGQGGVTSGPADVRLAQPQLRLAKDIIGENELFVGDTVVYRIRYGNASPTTAARGLVLSDTLPEDLELVRAPGAQVNGRVVRWFLPELAPQDSGFVTLVARVLARPLAGDIVNMAVLEGGAGRVAVVAHALALVIRAGEMPLAVTKSAGVLQVGAGEAIPYTIRVRNQSGRTLRGIVVEDRLPDGVKIVGKWRGADSARIDGGVARFYLSGSLQQGEVHTLRYSAVLVQAGRAKVLRNVAIASAENGRLRSDTASADVRMRGFEVQGRTLVGKVFVDENGNGRQDAGERGARGVRVWGADGEVVTTDAEGRFSFRDMLPGSHVVRLDTLSLPGGARASSGDLVQMIRTDGWTMPRVNFALRPGVSTARIERGAGAGGESEKMIQQAGEPTADTVVMVAPARTSKEREAEESQSFVSGKVVRIFAPNDGKVIYTNRLFIGVRGEAGMPVRLYDGEKQIGEATLRPDGVHDFIGVEVTPGPHRFRAWMKNSMGQERWDSVTVHHATRPDSLVVPAEPTTLRTDDATPSVIRVRVLDGHGVPVGAGTQVTVRATGVALQGEDTDETSDGDQRRVAAGGWVDLSVRGSRTPGIGRISIVAEKAKAEVVVRTLPSVHPLVAVGAAEIALVGSATGSGRGFGAVTMRGAIDANTAVSVSYDSRRASTDEQRLFGGEIDPLDGSRFPAVGDNSERRVLAPATGNFAARVERGFDWLEFGDVRPAGFAGDGRLLSYERSVTGMNGRFATGDVTWQAFGSMTSQRLEQRQLRALGGSGPFLLGGEIRPGTERVFIEVRAKDNAARVLDRRELQRVTDYEISYETGALLLRRAVPASDIADNPIFIIALVERRGAAERKLVGGLRAEVDAGRRLGMSGNSGLTLGASFVRDEAGVIPPGAGAPGVPLDVSSSSVSLAGADARLRRGGIDAHVELLHADVADSAATAGRAEIKWLSNDERVGVDARWMRVGQGFGASVDPRLSQAVDELRVGGSLKMGDSARAELTHHRERFEQFGVERNTTTARTEERLRGASFSQELGIATDEMSAGPALRSGTAAIGRLRLADGDERSVWLEGAREIESSGGASPQPDRIAAGATWKLFGLATAEAKHEWVSPSDAPSYQMSGLRLRGASRFGRMWGGIDRADAVRATNSAILGVDNQLRFAKVWSLESAFERRLGLGNAAISDPSRALPFAQQEPDYWTAALGASFLPGEDQPHATMRAEHRDGVDETSTRFSIAGDVPLGTNGAVLLRSDWRVTERGEALAAAAGRLSRDDRSVLGFAFRPTGADLFDALAKLEWRRTVNPLGGSTFADSTEYQRLIGTADAVWALGDGMELGLRYALRWSAIQEDAFALPSPFAQFAGARFERALAGRLSARLDGRMLFEQATGTARWSAAPSLLYRLTPTLHIEGGHRFGDLLDVDFGEETNRFFATIGVRFTERLLTTPASFWRDRLNGVDR